mmetsp:Transcript_30472/g.80816  ORF Transcript_30472/g.80816 Transcript_30472/m.80816 type:complete len:354 (-) Transcript_30472:669-1730(-)
MARRCLLSRARTTAWRLLSGITWLRTCSSKRSASRPASFDAGDRGPILESLRTDFWRPMSMAPAPSWPPFSLSCAVTRSRSSLSHCASVCSWTAARRRRDQRRKRCTIRTLTWKRRISTNGSAFFHTFSEPKTMLASFRRRFTCSFASILCWIRCAVWRMRRASSLVGISTTSSVLSARAVASRVVCRPADTEDLRPRGCSSSSGDLERSSSRLLRLPPAPLGLPGGLPGGGGGCRLPVLPAWWASAAFCGCLCQPARSLRRATSMNRCPSTILLMPTASWFMGISERTLSFSKVCSNSSRMRLYLAASWAKFLMKLPMASATWSLPMASLRWAISSSLAAFSSTLDLVCARA